MVSLNSAPLPASLPSPNTTFTPEEVAAGTKLSDAITVALPPELVVKVTKPSVVVPRVQDDASSNHKLSLPLPKTRSTSVVSDRPRTAAAFSCSNWPLPARSIASIPAPTGRSFEAIVSALAPNSETVSFPPTSVMVLSPPPLPKPNR